MAELTVKFKDPTKIIHLRGQVFHAGNLTQADYYYLVSFSSEYADLFEPIQAAEAADNQVQPKSKKVKDGNKSESNTSSEV